MLVARQSLEGGATSILSTAGNRQAAPVDEAVKPWQERVQAEYECTLERQSETVQPIFLSVPSSPLSFSLGAERTGNKLPKSLLNLLSAAAAACDRDRPIRKGLALGRRPSRQP